MAVDSPTQQVHFGYPLYGAIDGDLGDYDLTLLLEVCIRLVRIVN